MTDNELRVPTIALEAEIHYFDERRLIGRIFVPATAQRHGGPTRPEEWMNEPALFFPFSPIEPGPAMILNKRYVVVLSLALENPEPINAVSHRRVVVECGTLKLSGSILVEVPATRSRLLDIVNQGETFLTLLDGDRRHLIQKNRITSISEIPEN